MARYSLLIAAAGAREPWNSLDAEPEQESRALTGNFTAAERKEIDKCLRCPYPECVNCIDAWKAFYNIRYDFKKYYKRKSKCSPTKNTKHAKTGLPTVATTSEQAKPVQYSVWDLSPK